MYRVLTPVLLAVVTGFGAAVQADEDPIFSNMTAAIDIGRYHTDFAYPAADYRADIERYAIVVTQPVSANVDFGFDAAYLLVGVNSPALANLDQNDGHALGLSAAWHPRLGNYLGLELQAAYRWNDASFAAPGSQPEITWYASSVSAGPVLFLRNWQLSTGLRWQHDDGYEYDPGPPAAKPAFGSVHNAGAYLSLTYYLDPTGSLALQAFGGGQRGAQLVFKREF